MSNELALSEGTGLSRVNVASDLPAIFTLAKALKQAAGFLPAHLKTEGEIVAVVLAGQELGIPPMAAVRSIKLIKGNVTLDASMQLALMVRAGCKVQWLEDGTNGVARLQLERPGQAPFVSVFTLEMAKKAGLSGDNWSRHPQAMLRARCVTAAGKAYCPDVLTGVYLPDELPDDPQPVRAVPTVADKLNALAAEGERERPLALAQQTTPPTSSPSKPSTTAGDSHVEYDGEVVTEAPSAETLAAQYNDGFKATVEMANLAVTGEVDADTGCMIPPGECPTFQSGADAGVRYEDVPPGKLRALIASKKFREGASVRTQLWANYLVAKHEITKATGAAK